MNFDNAERLLSTLPVRDKLSQRLVPFRLNSAQKRLWRILRQQDANGSPMRAIVLKSRRQGISTLMDNLLAVHCSSRAGAHSAIITHDFKSSKALFKAPITLLESRLPGRPSLKATLGMPDLTQHLITFPHENGNSTLMIATAGNVEGARGMTFTDLHLSEAAFWQSEGAFAALLPTVPNSSDTIIVIESTANGRTGMGQAYYDFWNASLRGETGYEAIFLSWLEDPTCQDFNLNVDDAPIDDEEKLLMEGVVVNGVLLKAAPEQIAWRRVTLNSPACRGYAEVFDSEFPRTPDVAFVSTGEPAFTREEMAAARKHLTEGRHVEISIDGNFPRSTPRPVSRLILWEDPQPGVRYYFGVDAARGIEGKDFSAVVGINGDTGEQCVRYENEVDPEYLANFCWMLGLYFNKGMLCIELTGNLGLWVQSRLRDHYHYPNLYRWRGTRDDKIRPGGAAKGGTYGWETTYRSRERLLITYRECILHGMILLKDEEVVRQMDLATRKDAWTRWDIERGHDDVLFATMLANIARAEWHPRKLDGSYQSTLNEEEPKALARYQPQPTIEHVGLITAQSFEAIQRERQRYDRIFKAGAK